MTLHSTRFLINVDQYYKMAEAGIIQPSDRVELIHGEILTMSPINSPHVGIVNRLTKLFVRNLDDNATISIQNPIRINQRTEPEPDFVIAKFRKDEYGSKKITPKDTYLVVEVASSSLEYDRRVKIPLYAKAGIPEYWIINVDKKQIEQYTKPKGGEYLEKKIIRKKGKLICSTIELIIKGADIFL